MALLSITASVQISIFEDYLDRFRIHHLAKPLIAFKMSNKRRRQWITQGTLANWAAAAKSGTSPEVAPGSRSVSELEAEVSKLRKELAEIRMERDTVKKAAAYFARESLP